MATVFREEAGRLTAWLLRLLDDFPTAEEIVQDALVAALEQWSIDGIPESPRAWLRTVARRKAIDSVRRDVRFRERLPLLFDATGQRDEGERDNRLELIFMCCHPALAREAQIALTLRAICGLTTAQIARAFLVPEPTVAQRIVRAQRKIASAGIRYRIPTEDELDSRLAEVLAVLYLTFNEGYLSAVGDEPARHDVAEDAAWLAELLARLYPTEPEVLGLLALMRLMLARHKTRFDAQGELVLLREQDRTQWDRAAIGEAVALLQRAAALHKPGPYQLQAAIAACHAEAPTSSQTDWPQILVLYEMLLRCAPTPIGRLNHAVAVRFAVGPQHALALVDALTNDLDGYHLFHAVRADLLHALGQTVDARAAERRALELTRNPAEQSLLRRRLEAAC